MILYLNNVRQNATVQRSGNYFTDSLLYQENNEAVKEPWPDDINSGNEIDSESEDDAPATFSMKPIVAYLDDLNYKNPAKNEGGWILNKNITFDYSLCFEDILKSVDISSLHKPLPISKMACMHIKDNEGSVFIVPPSKGDQ